MSSNLRESGHLFFQLMGMLKLWEAEYFDAMMNAAKSAQNKEIYHATAATRSHTTLSRT